MYYHCYEVRVLELEEFPEDFQKLYVETVQYQKFLKFLKLNILDAQDYQEMRDKETDELVGVFLKKSGYYKLKRHFKVKIELIEWKYFTNDKGSLKWCYFHVMGSLPNGEQMDAFGGCDAKERGKKGSNDIIGTAHTRANLRAISQLVDFGSVGAEEIAKLEE